MHDQYDASSSLLGYLYQCRYALLVAIAEAKKSPALSVSIERFDDVAFEDDDTAISRIQTKHHSTAGDLSDKSSDLWKTLRIWSEAIKTDPSLPFKTKFVIITTGTAPEQSACANLRSERSLDKLNNALAALIKAASTSKNAATKIARDSFLSLSPIDQSNLVNAIYIFDRSPNISDARSEIEDLLSLTAPQEHVGTLVNNLEGWWFTRIIESLVLPDAQPIPLVQLRGKIDELRENFQRSGLPIDDFEFETPTSEAILADNRLFVQQLKAIALTEKTIGYSVRDFYRASAQRSRWARENLLLDGETAKYDRELVDRWQRCFQAEIDNESPQDPADRQKCGRNIFHKLNQSQVSLRNRSEIWLTTGSYQILADHLRIGWHPDYEILFPGKS